MPATAVLATLIRAAPMTVPATPRNEAATAPVTAASTLAITWVALMSIRRPSMILPSRCRLPEPAAPAGIRQTEFRAYAWLALLRTNRAEATRPGPSCPVARFDLLERDGARSSLRCITTFGRPAGPPGIRVSRGALQARQAGTFEMTWCRGFEGS